MGIAGAIRAGKAFVEIGTDNSALERGLRAAQAQLKAFGAGLRQIGAPLATIGGAVAGALLGAAKTFAAMGDNLDKMSARTGVSVEALSELGFAAEQSGADLDTLETGLRKMQKTVADAATGSSAAADALARLGLGVQDVVTLSPEQQFKLIADRLSQVADPTQRAASAMELFGKSGTKLLPMLEGGVKGIEALQEQARALGLTISTEAAADAARLTDTLNILWRVVKQGVFAIGASLAPTIEEVANAITGVVVRVTQWIRENQGLIAGVFRVAGIVAAVGAGLMVFGSVIGALASPLGALVVALGGAGAAFVHFSGTGRQSLTWLADTFAWLRDLASDVFGGIADALAAGDIGLAAQVMWAGLKVAWEAGIAPLRQAWVGFTYLFNQAWINATTGFKKAWISVSTWMYKNFPELTAFIARTWANLTGVLQKAWAKFDNWLRDKWLDVLGLFDEELDVDIAKGVGRQRLAEELGDIEAERQRAVAEADRRAGLTEAEHAAEQAAALAQAELERAQALAALDAEQEQRIEQAREALRAAQAELADARARAREARERAGPGAPGRPAWAEFEGLLDVGGRRGAMTAGTFSAERIGQLVVPSDRIDERMRTLIAEVREVKRAVERNRLPRAV